MVEAPIARFDEGDVVTPGRNRGELERAVEVGGLHRLLRVAPVGGRWPFDDDGDAGDRCPGLAVKHLARHAPLAGLRLLRLGALDGLGGTDAPEDVVEILLRRRTRREPERDEGAEEKRVGESPRLARTRGGA